jgi:hypothetical protein
MSDEPRYCHKCKAWHSPTDAGWKAGCLFAPVRPKKDSMVRFVVTKQGGPILNRGYVFATGENVAAIEIDMKSKRCEVMAESATEDGAPVIWIEGTNALHLRPGHEKEETEVAFPEYKGWRIFSAHVCRHTLRVCFVRDEAN